MLQGVPSINFDLDFFKYQQVGLFSVKNTKEKSLEEKNYATKNWFSFSQQLALSYDYCLL